MGFNSGFKGLSQPGKDLTVAVDKCNYNRTVQEVNNLGAVSIF